MRVFEPRDMDFIMSASLAKLLVDGDTSKLSRELELSKLADKLAQSMKRHKPVADSLLTGVSGKAVANDLVRSIGQFLPYDSTVRDVATTGHLGKLLSRKAVHDMIQDWRIVGLPHSLFDGISWRERNETMKEGVCHASDPEILGMPAVLKMLAKEADLVKRKSETKRRRPR